MMGLRSKTVTIASALAGLAVFSQAPEFAQQYRQRIGGAVDELKTVVVKFDTDAATSQMSRDEALKKLKRSKEQFHRKRSTSMGETIGRFERLKLQQDWLENSHPLTRPLLVLKSPDGKLLNRAWEIFEPAVPLTSPGAVYGGIGALIAMFLARFGIGGARRVAKVRSDRSLVINVEKPLAPDIMQGDANEEFTQAEDNPYIPSQTERAEIAAHRMQLAIANKKIILEEMQVTPMKPGNVPYLKTEK